MFAATLTGAGGGMIRDILARRKPMIFQSEVYAAWGILAGLIIGLNLAAWTFWNNDSFYQHCCLKDAVSEL